MSFSVFVRSWWKPATSPDWPDGREPCMGRKHWLDRRVATEPEARAICREYNATHKPGKWSRKAEYMEN